MSEKASEDDTLSKRLSNLTVKSLRNYCDIAGISGASNLKKGALVRLVIRESDPAVLREFLSSVEAEYLMDSFRRAMKWGMSGTLVRIGPGATHHELHAEFNGLDIGLRRVYYVDFSDVYDADGISTSCECSESSDRGLFCPHQMAVLIAALRAGLIRLNRWKGPMTTELYSAIDSVIPGR